MSSSKGKFVWRELMSSDLEGARAFYGGLFGWSWSKMDMPNMEYWVAAAGPEMVCGLMGQLEAPHPFWASYLGVDELDAAVVTVTEAGGEICMPPTDIPGTGRFSLVKDPTGANVMLFEGSDQGAAPGGMPGMHTFCWESLQTPDLEAAKAFYRTGGGWTYTPMGPEMALASAGADMVADLGPQQMGAPPHWSTHVAVADLDAARAKVEALGGRVLVPEIPVPGFGRMCIFQDPQGAVLSVFQGSGNP
jgi:predicted enzyme related to lactoylglutathione lyase